MTEESDDAFEPIGLAAERVCGALGKCQSQDMQAAKCPARINVPLGHCGHVEERERLAPAVTPDGKMPDGEVIPLSQVRQNALLRQSDGIRERCGLR